MLGTGLPCMLRLLINEYSILLAHVEHSVQRVPLDDTAELHILVADRETIVSAAIELLHNVAHGLLLLKRDGVLRHHISDLHEIHHLLGQHLEKRHVLQFDDVHVVDPPRKMVARPLCHHDSKEERQGEARGAGDLQQDHGQRDRDTCSTRKHRRSTNESVEAGRCPRPRCGPRRHHLHQLAHHSAEGRAREQRWHKQPAGHPEAVRPAGHGVVEQHEADRDPSIEVATIVVEERLEVPSTGIPEERLRLPKIVELLPLAAAEENRHPKADRRDEECHKKCLHEATAPPLADMA
mmetsp:Transcript_55438/g.142756  ORF Transcript_55438/g.142756 Transcript_55438/m.142756 type:complete len:294 (+) Transcript_55438:642-1523(+)